jgi:tetratricopeptide (TPR) repeat protein
MRKFSLVIAVIIISIGKSLSASPDSLLSKANQYYIDGNFDQAAELYQILVDSGYHNAELYYNLGNSYFKLNRIHYSIINFERAHILKPYDEDIEFNLEYARTFTIDRIEPIPVFFLVKWYRSVKGMLTSNAWAWVSLGLFAATLIFALLFWFSFSAIRKRLFFSLGIITLTLFIFSSVFSAQEKKRLSLRNEAIVFQTVVTVKSSPGESGKELFILHSGTKVTITKTIGNWVEIRIIDGNKGWIPSNTIELI